MTQTAVSVLLFVVLLALIPVGLKWVQRRSVGGVLGMASGNRVVSGVAVGPQQRVVTVEVGPEGARTWLVLGVTGQAISCLHVVSINGKLDSNTSPVGDAASTFL